MVGKDSIGSHHIAVQDAISSKIADHQFVVEQSMKDTSLEMFQKCIKMISLKRKSLTLMVC